MYVVHTCISCIFYGSPSVKSPTGYPSYYTHQLIYTNRILNVTYHYYWQPILSFSLVLYLINLKLSLSYGKDTSRGSSSGKQSTVLYGLILNNWHFSLTISYIAVVNHIIYIFSVTFLSKLDNRYKGLSKYKQYVCVLNECCKTILGIFVHSCCRFDKHFVGEEVAARHPFEILSARRVALSPAKLIHAESSVKASNNLFVSRIMKHAPSSSFVSI